MFRSYFLSWKWAPFSFGGAFLIAMLLYFQVDTAWRFAEWMNILGDVVSGSSKYTTPEFVDKFVYEAFIIGILFLLLNAGINIVSRLYQYFWYEAMTFHYFPNWNETLQDVDNPAERFQNSIEDFTSKLINMTKAIARSGMVLWKFLPKIWALSAHYNFGYLEIGILKVANWFALWFVGCVKLLPAILVPESFINFSEFHHVSGMLVWVVIGISLIGLRIAFLVGKNLKKCRKDLREARGFVRSCIEFIQRNKKREDSIKSLKKLIKDVKKCSIRLYVNQFLLDIWQGGYGQLWAVLPVTFFGFNVFSGYVKYGLVAKTQSALGEVIGAFSTPIWIFDEYTDYLSAKERLLELENKINNPLNWEEPKKEEGWDDRRHKIVSVDATGHKIEMTREKLEALLANFDALPDETSK
jgi:peptide/bleomycin uptake transporter